MKELFQFKKIVAILLLLFFGACASKKKTVEYKEKIVTDTLRIFKDRVISKAVIDTLLIESPCDTLGNLKDFEKTIKTDIAEVVLVNHNGNIQASINIDSIQQVWEKEYQSSQKKSIEIKEIKVVRNRIPFWMIITLFFSILLNIVLLRK